MRPCERRIEVDRFHSRLFGLERNLRRWRVTAVRQRDVAVGETGMCRRVRRFLADHLAEAFDRAIEALRPELILLMTAS